MSDLQLLISMGFSKERAEEALIETNTAGIEVALEWLLVTEEIDTIKSNKVEEFTSESKQKLPDSQVTCETVTCSTSVNSNKKTRILIRLLNGETLSKVFNATDKLNDVLLWIQLRTATKHFDLMTNFPKKVFTDEDYNQSLDELHLVPSAVMIVTEPDKWNNLKEYRGITTVDENRQVEEKRRKEEIEKQVKKMEEERVALERVRCQIDDDKAARRQRWPHLYANQPSGNQLVQNQPKGLLARDRSDRKKFE